MSAAGSGGGGGGGGKGGGGGGGDGVLGEEFLAKGPPWDCSCCKVKCTSYDTLMGHAGGRAAYNPSLFRYLNLSRVPPAASPETTTQRHTQDLKLRLLS